MVAASSFNFTRSWRCLNSREIARCCRVGCLLANPFGVLYAAGSGAPRCQL